MTKRKRLRGGVVKLNGPKCRRISDVFKENLLYTNTITNVKPCQLRHVPELMIRRFSNKDVEDKATSLLASGFFPNSPLVVVELSQEESDSIDYRTAGLPEPLDNPENLPLFGMYSQHVCFFHV